MIIKITDKLYLDKIKNEDKARYIELLKDREIYENTLNIPFPYQAKDADHWILQCQKEYVENHKTCNFAVRDQQGILIGGIGFHGFKIGKEHRAEVGYWLGKAYWGNGFMGLIVKKACQYAFNELQLLKITAHIFSKNIASEKVLLKNKFVQEGFLKKHYFKDGKYFDAKIYSLFKK